jgi:hypothetical protein
LCSKARSPCDTPAGLTNECNLACAFSYRDPTRLDRPLRSVNLGTGENGMHPDFAEFVSYLRSEPITPTSRTPIQSAIIPR